MAEMKAKKIDESAVKRRRRIVLIVLAEVILCLSLGIVADGAFVLQSYKTVELDDNFFVETGVQTRIETRVVTDAVG